MSKSNTDHTDYQSPLVDTSELRRQVQAICDEIEVVITYKVGAPSTGYVGTKTATDKIMLLFQQYGSLANRPVVLEAQIAILQKLARKYSQLPIPEKALLDEIRVLTEIHDVVVEEVVA